MLTDKQQSQLRYELKRRFMLNVEQGLDDAINQVMFKGINLGDMVTIELRLQSHVLGKTKEGQIQLEQVK